MISTPDNLLTMARRMLPDANLAVTNLPLCPEIQLWLFNGDALNRPLSPDEQLSIQEYPCYWAFCWASGHLLARYILDHPELVKDRTVIDIGCGSGVVAVAAAMAGARQAIGCDLDPDALAATDANARLNGVRVDLLDDFFNWCPEPGFIPEPLIVAADLLYDRGNLPLVDEFLQRSRHVLIGDSRIRDFSHPSFETTDTCESSNQPESSGFDEFHTVNVYQSF